MDLGRERRIFSAGISCKRSTVAVLKAVYSEDVIPEPTQMSKWEINQVAFC